MEATRVEQLAYIKIAVLRGKNAIECHSELVEVLGNNVLQYREVAFWVGSFNKHVCQPVMSNAVWQMMSLMLFSASYIVVVTVAGDYIECL
ncbi:HTH_48 domain-containing protein [Trichonephila clavipes]|nr:HTH_48 domain-containing protein [Trichonephila clavipes]